MSGDNRIQLDFYDKLLPYLLFLELGVIKIQ